jgi:hypothetical protein
MKKRFVLMGLVSVLLMATLLFAACSTGDDDGESGPSVTVPAVGNLPDLPADSTPVVTKDDAEALLTAFWESEAGWGLGSEIESVIEEYDDPISTNTGWKGEWDFKDNESADRLKISSAGNFSESTNVPEDEDKSKPPQKGYYEASSYSLQFAAEVTEDKTYEDVTLVAGSTIARALSGSDRWEITAVSEEEESVAVTVKYKISVQDAYGVGMTVIHDGKAGKIIIDLKGKISGSEEVTINDDLEPNLSGSVSGSVKVYGASDSLVYTMPITMKNVDNLVMDFLSMKSFFGE